MRNKIIAGNWKMYKTLDETTQFIRSLAPLVEQSQVYVYLAVPFTAIQAASKEAQTTNIRVGAQNMNDASEGAFTGEIASKMLLDAGAQFVILGHSERRHIFNETSDFINRKVIRALKDNIKPIVCIGEKEDDRELQKTEQVLKDQILESLKNLNSEEISQIILAYEPVWAIGTGKTATPEIAQKTQQYCRKVIAEYWNPEVAEKISILYGGSVKPNNAALLMGQPDIDGLLVGGASLEAEAFSQIINF
ncbi:MAG: tpiA [Chlamydiales bacterium]|jgi:triosephosphate isomerase|nr:tpiA [Chlamydiales bacterium]